TETSIRELFAAGLVPGIMGIFLYMAAVRWVVWRDPSAGPAGDKMPWKERFIALKGVIGILSLFTLVMGGIYLGVFTPTEAAGIGAGGAFLIALLRKSLTWATLFETLSDTARTTVMLFVVIIGALIFSDFVNRAGLPAYLLEFVTSMDVAPIVVILAIMGIYLLLGMIFESLSMMLLTIPIFYPVVASLGYDLVWFGIAVVIAIEISLITPPVGMNVFVLSAVIRDIKTGTIFKGVTPFWVVDIIRLLLVLFIAQITLFLPQLLYR
ncbi:MAG: TRAP transporter large permease subunit, partial [Pseudomonadaceae bacterium]|nr:TRAP transporter large permease subunit [Pseudomonadaceae bacterium]